MDRRHVIAILTVNIFVLVCFASGCKKDEAPQASAPAAEESVAGAEKTVQVAEERAKAVAKLAAADLHDGKADKVVNECLMCGLRMKGSADHASTYEGVSLHFCKAGCKKNFDEDPVAALLAVEIDVE